MSAHHYQPKYFVTLRRTSDHLIIPDTKLSLCHVTSVTSGGQDVVWSVLLPSQASLQAACGQHLP